MRNKKTQISKYMLGESNELAQGILTMPYPDRRGPFILKEP